MRRLCLMSVLLLAACGNDAAERAAPPPHAPPPRPAAPAGSPVAALQPGVEQSKEQLLQEVRKRQLTNEDFKETATNRDPFRSFLSTFATQVVNVKPQHRILLDKFALEELKLVAIVQSGDYPRAMLVDPTSKGWVVKRGDYIGRPDTVHTGGGTSGTDYR